MKKWQPVRLDQCCDIVSGATPNTSIPSYWDGDIPWATPKDLSCLETAYISDTPRKLTAAGLESCSAAVLPAGSVLFSSRAPIGHVAINTVPMATNQGFKSFIPRNGKVDAGYLFHWLRANRSYLEGLGNGATFKEVSKSVISRVTIPLPLLSEQRRIAEVLDKAEELRAKRRNVLEQLDNLSSSIFIECFSDSAPATWAKTNIVDIAKSAKGAIRTGPFGSQLLHSEFVDDGVAVLGIDNVVANEFRWGERRYITEAKYRQLNRYTVHPGDVLITIMGTCGRCAVVPTDIPVAINTKHLCCITVDAKKCLPTFLQAYFLQHPAAKRYLAQTAKGAIMSGLNMEIIKGMPIILPPMALQEKFALQIASMEKLKTAQRASLAELDALFASLQHRAFRGEL